ncbi:MAG: Type pili twitching motility protein PilT [Fibrobacteres bacterium]|nr:Type pili twitching motility protein PilT [Fibrobacterota bacterium]
MIDNQQAAQLLFNHRMASQEQLIACWPDILPEKDIGMVLMEKGIITPQTYRELAAYLNARPAASEPLAAAQSGAGGASHGDLAIESDSPVSPADVAPPEPVAEIRYLEDETWTAAPDEGGEPSVRKTTRAEHQIKKASASVSLPAVEPFIESRPPVGSIPSSGAVAPDPGPRTAVPGPIARAGSAGIAEAPASVGPESTWEGLLAFARANEAADLHLSAGNPILLRRYGSLQAATQGPMDQTCLRAWVEAALTPAQLKDFEATGDLEIIYTLNGWGRYRVTLIKQRRGWDVTARVIPSRIRGFEEAGLPESTRELTKWAQGLVLVTGPVGCGKSSTLATLVEMVNQERHDHIITIEEPIEIVYEPAHCRITQRQIGPHTLSRDAALRAALREDPDIIVISELRDLDTIRLAVSAAETGHLVFGTMNTTNAARTLFRLVDSFPPEEQGIIRNMISESLRGVISQQLLPRKDGMGMLPAFEVLLVNTAVSNMIRKDEAHQLGTAMLTGKSSGMVLLDDSLRYLIDKGMVDAAEAMPRATNPKDFEKYLGRR